MMLIMVILPIVYLVLSFFIYRNIKQFQDPYTDFSRKIGDQMKSIKTDQIRPCVAVVASQIKQIRILVMVPIIVVLIKYAWL